MALSTYTELKASVASWLHRTDLTTQIVDFIDLAEAELNAELHTRLMETDESLSLSSGASTVALPARFVEPISLELVISGQENTTLSYQPRQRLALNAASGASARPKYWTINGNNIQFPNVSDAAYTLTFRMVKGYDLAATSTNDLLTDYPGLYLYGALIQAAPFLIDDQRIPTWQRMYQTLLAKVKRKESRRHALTSLVTDCPSVPGRQENIITG